MADNLNNQSGTGQEPVAPICQISSELPPIDGSRRHFTSAGLAATGVIMTLASRPVLGCTGAGGLSPSGWSSINASRCTNTAITLGRSHGYWKNNSFPSGISSNTPCKNVFPGGVGALNTSTTLLQALNLTGNSGLFPREIVSAYLNASAGLTLPYLTVQQVKKMSTGSFTPSTGGTPWDQAKILSYLANTYN